jgi:unsaturated chondroitin disaccharide hydrolase
MFDEKLTLARALAKVTKTAERVRDRIPYRTVDGVFDDWSDTDISWWTNGFWPGLLWLTWRETGDRNLATWAEGVEGRLDQALIEHVGLHHDVGFMWYISSGARYRLIGGESARTRTLHAANVLAGRFNLAGRFLRAWNDDKTGWAIIDCLMNLPLLYWATTETGDPRFRQIAEAHTATVLQHFLYPDGSSRHIVEFDASTGAYLRTHAGQGYSDTSAWSRGCAWALHGLALGAQYTGRADFLAGAEKVAGYFLANLPGDKVPIADFKAPQDRANHKDSSAAACAASGLLLLATLVPERSRQALLTGAKDIVASLAENYADWDGTEALLSHGCASYDNYRPGWEDTSLIYGDYYFLEALTRLNGKPGLFSL